MVECPAVYANFRVLRTTWTPNFLAKIGHSTPDYFHHALNNCAVTESQVLLQAYYSVVPVRQLLRGSSPVRVDQAYF